MGINESGGYTDSADDGRPEPVIAVSGSGAKPPTRRTIEFGSEDGHDPLIVLAAKVAVTNKIVSKIPVRDIPAALIKEIERISADPDALSLAQRLGMEKLNTMLEKNMGVIHEKGYLGTKESGHFR